MNLPKYISQLVMMFVGLAFPMLADAEQLIVATGDWPPYVSKNLKHHGITAHITTEAFKLVGDDVTLKYYPWKRALLVSKNGLVDASFPWSHKPEREVDHLYSDPIGDYGYVIFHLKKTPFQWQSLKDLKSYRIGATSSYNYGDAFIAAGKSGELNIAWSHSDEINWKMLVRGRIDLFPSDREAGYAKLQEIFQRDAVELVTHHRKPLKPLTTMHLLFPKDNPKSEARLQRFNRGLAMLRESGKMEEYLSELNRGQYELPSSEKGIWKKK